MAKDNTFLTQKSEFDYPEANVEWFVIHLDVHCPHCGLWQQEEFECDEEHWDTACIECKEAFHVTMPHLQHKQNAK